MEYIQNIFSLIPRRLWILLALLWMSLIFLLSSRQRISVSEQYWANFLVFKLLHVIEYAVLTFLYLQAIYKNIPVISLRRATLFALIFALCYGISDEIHQTFVPTREGTVRDVLIDSIGIVSVYWFASRYERFSKNSPRTVHTQPPK